MRKNFCTLLSLLLSVSLLAGCGASPEQRPNEEAAAEEAVPVSEETVYQAEYISLQNNTLTAGLSNGTAIGDELYFTSLGVLRDETPEGAVPEWPEQFWVYGPVLCRVGFDGSVEQIPYMPELPESGVNGHWSVLFEKLCAGQNGTLWLLEKVCRSEGGGDSASEKDENASEPAQGEESYRLVHLKTDGTVLSSWPMDWLMSHAENRDSQAGDYSFRVNGLSDDGNGRLYLAVSEWVYGTGAYAEDNRIFILNEDDGSAVHTFQMDSEAEKLAALGDGRIAVSFFGGGTQQIGILDAGSSVSEDPLPVSDYIDVLTAGGEDGMLYYSAGDSFYRLDPAGGESSRLLNWTESDVALKGGESILVLNDGRIVTSSTKTTGRVENELIILSPSADGQRAERKVLRLAVMNLYPFTSEMVIRFNRSNPDYRIEVTDYSQYNDYTSGSEAGWNAGLTRLQTEIIAGDVPDILDLSLLPADRIGAKGLLEDLYPYIDRDPEFGRKDLQEHVLSAFEENGKLYQTVGNYYILTTAGLSSRVGDQMGWTMDDFQTAMQALRAENPNSTVFDSYITRDLAMTFLLYLEMERFVDWETGECFFDTDAFLGFLEFLRSFPDSYAWNGDTSAEELDSDTRIRMGYQLMKQCNFVCFEDVQKNTAGFGEMPRTFVGYPTESGVGSMFAQIGNSLSISSGCSDKEAAWQFVRMFFLPEYQEQFLGSVFPTNRAVYEKMKQEAMAVQYRRNPDGSFVLDEEGKRMEADRVSEEIGGTTYYYHPVTEAEVSQIEEITEATTRALRTDDSLKEIIVNDAAPCFAGQRSVEDTAKLIQSRASIYVNEQR